MIDANNYAAAVANPRVLLCQIGRQDFRAYGYSAQLRRYHQAMRAVA